MNCRPLPVARFLLAGLLILLGGTAHADETLTYDPNGNVVSRTLPGGTTTYQYDDLDRITAEAGPARTQTLTYDPNGNRKSDTTGTHTYTPNTDRQLTIAGQNVTLDATGNVTQARNLGFVWNTAGQLAEVRQGSPTGTLLASYNYDYQGRRTRKVLGGGGPLNYRTTIYTYDQYGRLSGEFDGAGHPQRTYVWRDDVPLAVIEHGSGNDVVYYLETDHLGSPIAARDQDGTVVWRWTSDAFGATLANEDADGNVSTVTVNLRFPGQYYDKESGLHYNHHRYYDPKLGRYISSDPVGIAGGLNTYGYANQNPLTFTDPRGEAVGAVAIGGGVLIIGGVIYMSGPSGKKAINSIAQKIQDLCKPEDKDPCEQQLEEDESDCFDNYGSVFGYSHFSFQGCMKNARTRYEQCTKGQPPIPKWDDGHVTGQPPISPRKK